MLAGGVHNIIAPKTNKVKIPSRKMAVKHIIKTLQKSQLDTCLRWKREGKEGKEMKTLERRNTFKMIPEKKIEALSN